jgi:hypothetical protein
LKILLSVETLIKKEIYLELIDHIQNQLLDCIMTRDSREAEYLINIEQLPIGRNNLPGKWIWWVATPGMPNRPSEAFKTGVSETALGAIQAVTLAVKNRIA